MEIDSHEREHDLDAEDELDRILSKPTILPSEIDDALRDYLQLASLHKDSILPAEDDLYECTLKFLTSTFFETNREYICLQFIHCFLQEDAPNLILTLATCLLLEGRRNVELLELMRQEGVFVRLVYCIRTAFQHANWEEEDGSSSNGHGGTARMDDVEEARAVLYRVFLDLTYEMSRVQEIPIEDLVCVDDDFVQHLFGLIEGPAIGDPFHYPVIRVLLVLNEQFLLSLHGRDPNDSSPVTLTNKVIKVLSKFGNKYRTFGENIILFLNRENETSLQLLILKLLYLLFTFPPTYEYFYTNDLRVLVDILIRNLYDLPPGEMALRHTYLRVLHPLLAHTQLRKPGYHYKREELQRLLGVILSTDRETNSDLSNCHFDGDLDETTRRLALRCCGIEWIQDIPADPKVEGREVKTNNDKGEEHSPVTVSSGSYTRSIGEDDSAKSPLTTSPTLSDPSFATNRAPQLNSQAHCVLGMRLHSGSQSSQSVLAVANHTEKPGNIISICSNEASRGVLTSSPPPLAAAHFSPSPDQQHALPSSKDDTSSVPHSGSPPVKVKPEPPLSRRSQSRRAVGRRGSVSSITTNNSDVSSVIETNHGARQVKEKSATVSLPSDTHLDTPTDALTPPLIGQPYCRYKTSSISSSRSLPMQQQPPGTPAVPIRRTASAQPQPPPPRRSQNPMSASASVTSSPLSSSTSTFDHLSNAVHNLHIEHRKHASPPPPPPPPPPPLHRRQHQHQHQHQYPSSSPPYVHTPSPLSPSHTGPHSSSSPKSLPPLPQAPPEPPLARRSRKRRPTVSKQN